MGFAVKTTDFKEITLNEQDTVKSVLQNVAIILESIENTNVLYRDFGISNKMVDMPQNVILPQMYAEIKEKIEKYEPRASVINIVFENDTKTLGQTIPTVEITINDRL